MRDAKDYKNTIEFAAEKWYTSVMNDPEVLAAYGRGMPTYQELTDDDKTILKSDIIYFLNILNYFENKTCSDCGYFDPVENVCFGEDREHKEQSDNPICETFAPRGLVEELP